MSTSDNDLIRDYLNRQKDNFARISQFIYEHPEIRFQEHESAAFLASECEKAGFTVEKGIAGIETAFVAT